MRNGGPARGSRRPRRDRLRRRRAARRARASRPGRRSRGRGRPGTRSRRAQLDAVELRDVAAAQPDRLDLQHRTARRRIGHGELADLVAAIAEEHRGVAGSRAGEPTPPRIRSVVARHPVRMLRGSSIDTAATAGIFCLSMSSTICSRKSRGITHSAHDAPSRIRRMLTVLSSTPTTSMSPPSACTSARASSRAGSMLAWSITGKLLAGRGLVGGRVRDRNAPASARMSWPVMQRARSDARNTDSRPSSSCSTIRRSGVEATMFATCDSSNTSRTFSVSVVPGAIACTRMPCGPSSTAIVCVRWLIADLADP